MSLPTDTLLLNSRGLTPLHLICHLECYNLREGARTKLLKLVLPKAKIEKRDYKVHIACDSVSGNEKSHARSIQGRTALHFAAGLCLPSPLVYLLQNGADINS